jgi:hypothetical protein
VESRSRRPGAKSSDAPTRLNRWRTDSDLSFPGAQGKRRGSIDPLFGGTPGGT